MDRTSTCVGTAGAVASADPPVGTPRGGNGGGGSARVGAKQRVSAQRAADEVGDGERAHAPAQRGLEVAPVEGVEDGLREAVQQDEDRDGVGTAASEVVDVPAVDLRVESLSTHHRSQPSAAIRAASNLSACSDVGQSHSEDVATAMSAFYRPSFCRRAVFMTSARTAPT